MFAAQVARRALPPPRTIQTSPEGWRGPALQTTAGRGPSRASRAERAGIRNGE